MIMSRKLSNAVCKGSNGAQRGTDRQSAHVSLCFFACPTRLNLLARHPSSQHVHPLGAYLSLLLEESLSSSRRRDSRLITMRLVGCLIFSALIAFSVDVVTGKKNPIVGFDICRNSVCADCAQKIFRYTQCGVGWPLGDGRWDGDPGQCRVFCTEFLNDAFRAYAISSNCTYCQTQEAFDKYAIREGLRSVDGEPQYCVPRLTCIEQCGPERDGCVYSGTCGSQICFEGAKSKKPATKKRVTFDGPATLMAVVNSTDPDDKREVWTTSESPFSIPYILEFGYEWCESRGTGFVTANYCDDLFQPLSNALLEPLPTNRQCRSACISFERSEYEMLRISTNCTFCESSEADEFMEGESNVCIPRELCIKQCGPEPQGCVYTGSCRSLMCFSGVDSRRPATLSLKDTGEDSVITVDNSGDPISEDPPAFNPDLPSPPPTPSSSPSPLDPPAQNQPSTDVPSSQSDEKDEEANGSSTWVWLGPLIGVAVLSVVAATLIAVNFVQRKRAGANERPVTI